MAIGVIALKHHTNSKPKFMHIETILVAEEHHNRILASHMAAHLFMNVAVVLGDLPKLVSMKTYNPRSYSMMARFLPKSGTTCFMYPNIENRTNTDEAKEIAENIANELEPNLTFNHDTGVIYAASGNVADDFWPSFPNTRNNIMVVSSFYCNSSLKTSKGVFQFNTLRGRPFNRS